MRLQLVVQMADEYFSSKEYGQALTYVNEIFHDFCSLQRVYMHPYFCRLFSHILWDYKEEKWWLLQSKLLTRALSCACVAANVQDYIHFSLEALGPLAKFDTERKLKIFNNLMAVLNVSLKIYFFFPPKPVSMIILIVVPCVPFPVPKDIFAL